MSIEGRLTVAVFFFSSRRRHTRWTGEWSSDVCSSDLNGEVAVLEQLAGRDPAAVPEPYRLTIRWTAEQLGPEQQRFLAARPKTRCRNLPGLGEMLYCHATPRNENECFTRLTPESRLCRFSRDWA